jgi:hypothetical protein
MIAFADSNSSTWTKLQAARLLVQIAAIPGTIPEPPQAGDEGVGG